MMKMEREALYPHPNRGIKTKILGLVFMLIGALMFQINTYSFVDSVLEKAGNCFELELRGETKIEVEKDIHSIIDKCLSENPRFLNPFRLYKEIVTPKIKKCPNTEKTNCLSDNNLIIKNIDNCY